MQCDHCKRWSSTSIGDKLSEWFVLAKQFAKEIDRHPAEEPLPRWVRDIAAHLIGKQPVEVKRQEGNDD